MRAVVQPQAGRLARRLRGLAAHVLQPVALRRAWIQVGVAGHHTEFAREREFGLQLHAGRTHLARLHAEPRMVRILRRHVGLADVEHCGGKERIGARRLVLQADLVLLALARLERGAVELLSRDGVERRGIAHVRRDAVVEQI
ncbi:hypothetical protein D3C72_1964960 [compost metagenome]